MPNSTPNLATTIKVWPTVYKDVSSDLSEIGSQGVVSEILNEKAAQSRSNQGLEPALPCLSGSF